MTFRFTKHARAKFVRMRQSGFRLTQTKVKETIAQPSKTESRDDGTFIATSLFDSNHVLRVVYRKEGDIIVIITFYPGRRKAYDI